MFQFQGGSCGPASLSRHVSELPGCDQEAVRFRFPATSQPRPPVPPSSHASPLEPWRRSLKRLPAQQCFFCALSHFIISSLIGSWDINRHVYIHHETDLLASLARLMQPQGARERHRVASYPPPPPTPSPPETTAASRKTGKLMRSRQIPSSDKTLFPLCFAAFNAQPQKGHLLLLNSTFFMPQGQVAGFDPRWLTCGHKNRSDAKERAT